MKFRILSLLFGKRTCTKNISLPHFDIKTVTTRKCRISAQTVLTIQLEFSLIGFAQSSRINSILIHSRSGCLIQFCNLLSAM